MVTELSEPHYFIMPSIGLLKSVRNYLKREIKI